MSIQRATHGMEQHRLRIRPSATADTRSCDYASVDILTLRASSEQHIEDVRAALMFFGRALQAAAEQHDTDKITDIEGFHADFVHGFDEGHQTWWERHRRLNRHHLQQADGVPDDVNLIDVLDMVADCVMAGMARTGTVYPLTVPDGLLERALANTVTLLKGAVVVVRDE